MFTSVKSLYDRITLTPLTAIFFLFCFVHCFVEGFIQAYIYTTDSTAYGVTTSILQQAKVPDSDFSILRRTPGNDTLQLCNMVPTYVAAQQCELIFETGHPNMTVPQNFNLTNGNESKLFADTDLKISATPDSDDSVHVTLFSGESVTMNQMCTLVLTYPHQVLMNAEREDIVLVVTQFWILCISVFAIAYTSVPHLIAALCFRTLATAWSMYIIWRTNDIYSRFTLLLEHEDSPCQVKVDELFAGYFATRRNLQIPDLTLNTVALAVSIYLTVKLIKIYGPNTFNRVGAPKHIIRIYNYFLAVFVSFQLAAFLLVAMVCLWLDQMLDKGNAIGDSTFHRPLYIALSICTLALLTPWIAMGWYSVRREWKRLMLGFLGISAIIFASWILMAKSWSFAFTFVNWPFFACLIVASTLSLLSTIVFGVLSLLHFGKGLAHYLYVDQVLAKAGFEEDVFEKDVSAKEKEWDELDMSDMPTYTLNFTTQIQNRDVEK
ncbi:unnamed protein product [Mycena citricolor]|uniref:Uncharacterized protein n=1 Tax=Mycena citricolor TaxID=2018698 RepID=A0AAD2H5Y9_9AGAR|nr:unnamed protein product [Mycena citricolor]